MAKFEKKSPQIIASELVETITPPEFIEEIEAKGPYINLRIASKPILRSIFKYGKDYGKTNDKEMKAKQTIVIEFPSPNTNKPLHLGHVRNMLIGNVTSRLLNYKEHEVFQVNLNNDRGIHICKSMLAYKKWGENREPNKKPDHFVGDFYVLYSQREENENLQDETQEMLKKWENDDPETRKLWKKMNSWAIQGFNETYEKFDIHFDKVYNESEFYWKGKEKVLEGLKKGLFEKREDGAIIAPLKESCGLPDKVLLRKDGTSIYITQDIFLAYLKKKDFNYTRSIYVVGNEQDLYFKQLFAVLEMLGFQEDKFHLSYGMIYLPEGKMKSREGKVVDADELVQEMKELAFQEVQRRYPELKEEEKLNRSEIIGMGALRFFILKYSPRSDFIFNPEESISFEGETGPYVQYSYARIESIIKKSKQQISLNAIDYSLLKHEKELEVISLLSFFPDILQQVTETYNLHLIPQFLLSLAQSFSSFYSSCQVISEDKELQKARLLLIKCIQIVIKTGLNILGIDVLEEM